MDFRNVVHLSYNIVNITIILEKKEGGRVNKSLNYSCNKENTDNWKLGEK